MVTSSGNPNPVQTDEFKEKSKATQFGGENANQRRQDIPGRSDPYMYRKSLAYIATLELEDEEDIMEVLKQLQKKRRFGTGKRTIALSITARMLESLYAKPRGELFDKIIDQTEGKQVSKVQEIPAPKTIRDDFITEEEAAEAHAQFGKL